MPPGRAALGGGGAWGATRWRGDRSAPGARSSCQPPEALPSRPAGSEEAGSRTPPSGCLRPAGQPRSSSGRESFLPRPSRSRAPAPGPAPGGHPRPRFPLPAASARLPDPWGLGRPRRQRPRPTAHYDIFLPGLRRLRRHRQPDTARPAPANPGARHRPSDGSVRQSSAAHGGPTALLTNQRRVSRATLVWPIRRARCN